MPYYDSRLHNNNNIKSWLGIPELKSILKAKHKSSNLYKELNRFKPYKSNLNPFESIMDEYTHPMTRIESANIIKFIMNRVLKALPTDNARLFFLQSELIDPEFKEYQQNKWFMPIDGAYKYEYYCKVQRQLKSLKEKTHDK